MNSILRNKRSSLEPQRLLQLPISPQALLSSQTPMVKSRLSLVSQSSSSDMSMVLRVTSKPNSMQKSLHLSQVQRHNTTVVIKHGRHSILLQSQNLPISTSRTLVSPLLSLVRFQIHSQEIYEQTSLSSLMQEERSLLHLPLLRLSSDISIMQQVTSKLNSIVK